MLKGTVVPNVEMRQPSHPTVVSAAFAAEETERLRKVTKLMHHKDPGVKALGQVLQRLGASANDLVVAYDALSKFRNL